MITAALVFASTQCLGMFVRTMRDADRAKSALDASVFTILFLAWVAVIVGAFFKLYA